MDSIDLTRVKVDEADACLVLANKYSSDPDAEDAVGFSLLELMNSSNFAGQHNARHFHQKLFL